MRTLETEECFVVKYEPFAKFASRWDLLPGRIVIPGSAGVPPAPDLAGRWRLASQTWSVHRMTGTGQQLYKNAGGTPALPGGEPTASQVQIHPEPADHDPCPPLSCPIANFAKGSNTTSSSDPAPVENFKSPLWGRHPHPLQQSSVRPDLDQTTPTKTTSGEGCAL